MLAHRIRCSWETKIRRPFSVLAAAALVVAALLALTFATSSLVRPQTASAQTYCNGMYDPFNMGCSSSYSGSCNGAYNPYATGCYATSGSYNCNGVGAYYTQYCGTMTAANQYCNQYGNQFAVANSQYCGNTSAYTCNGAGYPYAVACSTTAATTCSNGTTAYYGGQPCPATYASCSNGGQVLAGQQCSSVLGVSSIAPTNAYTSSSYTAAPGFGVSYAAGWNMVAGPTGTTLTGTSGPLYTWGSGSTAYGTQPSGSALSAGIGAWAYFRAATSTTIGLANPGSMTVQLPAGQFVMIGNSGDTTATVSGADSVFVYSSATGSYNQSTQLAAGQGAWAFSFNGGSATLTNSPA